MKQIYVESYFRNGYSRFMKYIYNVINHPKRESIEKRLEIIKFFDEFGDEAGFCRNVLTKVCGLELIGFEKGKYHLRVYNPRFIHDLNITFESLKKKLIDDETGYRKKFVDRCKDIRLEQLT